MSIHDGGMPDPTAYHRAETPKEDEQEAWQLTETTAPPVPQAPAPPAPPSTDLFANDGSYSTPPLEHKRQSPNPWASHEAIAAQPHHSDLKHVAQDDQSHGPWPPRPNVGNYQNENPLQVPRPVYQAPVTPPKEEESLLLDDEDESSRPSGNHVSVQPQQYHQMSDASRTHPEQQSFSDQNPPAKPPRPAVVVPLTEEQLAKNAEYRTETYQIKHFNWFDHGSGRLRRSSMLTQNKNGPCPLLALVNALILGAGDASQAALDDALRAREQVSLGLIIETLMYELVDRSSAVGQQLPDVDELNAFLLRLRTGMNANPRFVSAASPPPNLMDARNSMLHVPSEDSSRPRSGSFEATGDLKLYGAFGIPLVHGWLPEAGSDAALAFGRSAQTYEDAQAIQFGEEELEYKLTRQGLTPDEQRVWEDITSIKSFFRMHPTQLTPNGLQTIQQTLRSGSFAIMFRNDHFSTIYKHPQSGQLYTLITDAGYADRDEVIWESLVDISGNGNEFFSGDFMPVSHHAGEAAATSSQHLRVEGDHNEPLSPQQQQEQHDADFAMALQLQEEEEQRQRAEQSRRRRSGQQESTPARSPRGSTGNIPITLTRSRQSQSDAPENRPSIPPRNQRAPATNRPSDANDEDAPPAYEEAAKGKPYIPPVGSPLHPSSGGTDAVSPMSSSAQLTGTISTGGPSSSAHPPGPNAPHYGAPPGQPPRPSHGRIPSNMSGRAPSAYNEMSSLQTPIQQMPGSYWDGRRPGGPQQGIPVGSSRPGRQPGQERDCVVM
jgi:ubiquitin carboxyl-terminal hydrolase MINDY-1/2